MTEIINIAVSGCAHGKLDEVFAAVARHEARAGVHVELLICTGDFEALRSSDDFDSFKAPPKYQHLGAFQNYYSGKLLAPYLTIVIGGNHESCSYSWELFYGGWLCPRVYFMGAAGAVVYRGLRLVGLSGIYNHRSYGLKFYPVSPYVTVDRKTEAFHYKQNTVEMLKLLTPHADILISHDWPVNAANSGDTAALLRRKPHFRNDIQQGQLGSIAVQQLVEHFRPQYHFASHMHVKFIAQLPLPLLSNQSNSTIIQTQLQKSLKPTNNSINIPNEETTFPQSFVSHASELKKQQNQKQKYNYIQYPQQVQGKPFTLFVALDKMKEPWEQERESVQLFQIPIPINQQQIDIIEEGTGLDNLKQSNQEQQQLTQQNDAQLSFDPEWLTLIRIFHPHMKVRLEPTRGTAPLILPQIQTQQQSSIYSQDIVQHKQKGTTFLPILELPDARQIYSLLKEQDKQQCNQQLDQSSSSDYQQSPFFPHCPSLQHEVQNIFELLKGDMSILSHQTFHSINNNTLNEINSQSSKGEMEKELENYEQDNKEKETENEQINQKAEGKGVKRRRLDDEDGSLENEGFSDKTEIPTQLHKQEDYLHYLRSHKIMENYGFKHNKIKISVFQ
ncbi:MAG: putative Lariat debranching enzyme [Streblomastix strix]|uniref:Putative Lariat debranching enzyme n=1 Tax=Streblomastix strix TaxID=222440 RepID=A0A5J4WH69_9EUKA|nr:MAG: putative Lariat debranching enzyme [Streblomastix strix]